MVFGGDYADARRHRRARLHPREDLAAGHVAALKALADTDEAVHTWNLGTGHGTSVLEMVRAFEKAVGRGSPTRSWPRRPGDVATSYADPATATRELGWTHREDGRRHVRRHAGAGSRRTPQGFAG